MKYQNIFYGWWVLIACMTIAFGVAGTTFYGFTALFEPLIKEFGWSYTAVSFAFSLRGLEMGIFAPIVGFLVDRFGPRRLMLSGVVLIGIGFFSLSFTRNLPMFYGSMIIISFGSGGCTSVVSMSAVANWFKLKIGRALGIMASGFGLSGLLIPLLVWLIGAYGWRRALFIIGSCFFVIGIPLALIIRDRPEDYGLHPDGITSDKPALVQKCIVDNEDSLIRFIVSEKSYLLLCLVETLRMSVLATVATHIMPYLSTMDFKREIAGIITAAIPVVSVIGRFCFGWLSDSLPKYWLLSISFFFIAVGLLAFCFINIPGMLYIFLFFFPIGFGGGMVLRGAIIRDYFGNKRFGKLIGIIMGFSALGSIIGPTITGFVFDYSGRYLPVWMTFVVSIAITSTLAFKVKRARAVF